MARSSHKCAATEDQPLLELLLLRQQADDQMEHRSSARHCQVIRQSLECFVQGWKNFHADNHGQIPVECQAGRAAMGLEAAQTRLEPIYGDGRELPLRFFLSGQPQLVAEYLCRIWNEVVDAAIKALSHMQTGHASKWAAQMRTPAPVWLADLFFQEPSSTTQERCKASATCVQTRQLGDGFRVCGNPIIFVALRDRSQFL